jgi:hypothetical protein
MAKIKATDMKLTEESLEQVKGGPAYIKIGDIKGESRDTSRGGGGAGKVKFDRFTTR